MSVDTILIFLPGVFLLLVRARYWQYHKIKYSKMFGLDLAFGTSRKPKRQASCQGEPVGAFWLLIHNMDVDSGMIFALLCFPISSFTLLLPLCALFCPAMLP